MAEEDTDKLEFIRKLTELEEKLQEEAKARAYIEQKYSAVKEQCAESESNCEKWRAELAECGIKLAQSNRLLAESDLKCVDFGRRCAANEQLCSSLEQKCFDLENQLETYDLKCKNVESKLVAAESRYAVCEHRRLELEHALLNSECKNSTSLSELEHARAETARLNADLTALELVLANERSLSEAQLSLLANKLSLSEENNLNSMRPIDLKNFELQSFIENSDITASNFRQQIKELDYRIEMLSAEITALNFANESKLIGLNDRLRQADEERERLLQLAANKADQVFFFFFFFFFSRKQYAVEVKVINFCRYFRLQLV